MSKTLILLMTLTVAGACRSGGDTPDPQRPGMRPAARGSGQPFAPWLGPNDSVVDIVHRGDTIVATILDTVASATRLAYWQLRDDDALVDLPSGRVLVTSEHSRRVQLRRFFTLTRARQELLEGMN